MAEPAPSLDAFIPPGNRSGRSPNSASPGDVEVFDITKSQDKVRSNIAYWLVAALLFVIVIYCGAGLVGALDCATSKDCKSVTDSLTVIRDYLSVALASISGLVGAVTGFYFGAQTAKKA